MNVEINWSEIEVIPSTPPKLRTHLNYVIFMKEFSDKLEIKLNFNINSKSKFKKTFLSKKLKLIRIIKENLDDEYKKAIQEKEFAKICSLWIPVKSYYLIFNQLLVLCALINDEEGNLDYSHKRVIANFSKMLKENKISFNKTGFNQVYTCKEINNFKTKIGDNLRKKDVEEELRIRGILKKLCSYKFESYCRENGVKDRKKKKDREKCVLFFDNYEISLFEFFYWYRIKANYKDLSFLDQNVHSGDITQFYENYYLLTINFYNSLKNLINEVSQRRVGEKIIA